jgi:sarcosine oxidase/L-pipecolate oxidase
MQKWHTDPLFSPFYHETGFIMAAATPSGYKSCLEYQETENADLTALNSAEDFKSTMPAGVLTGPFPGWKGFWKRKGAGWVEASKAVRAMYDEATKRGVSFICSPTTGLVSRLIYSTTSPSVSGAITSDGKSHLGSTVILAAGANAAQLLDFEEQLVPKAWTLAHVPLTASEAKLYNNLPVLYAVDRGFFIEPQEGKGELKICDEHPGYINPVANTSTYVYDSIPFAKQQIPIEAESRMRLLLRETMPHLADRKFSYARVCWDADTIDRMFLIDRHPALGNLVVAVGGSGNGFMAAPAVGEIVADLVDGKEGGKRVVGDRVRNMMRWRPELCVGRDVWDTQGRHGGDEKIMNIMDVGGWTRIGE